MYNNDTKQKDPRHPFEYLSFRRKCKSEKIQNLRFSPRVEKLRIKCTDLVSKEIGVIVYYIKTEGISNCFESSNKM